MDKIKEKPHTVASVREKIKAAPKELVHRGLEDGSDRLRTQLRDAAQQGRRDDYGGDQIEDAAAGGMRRMERGAEKLIKEKRKKHDSRGGSPADPAAGDPVPEVRTRGQESRVNTAAAGRPADLSAERREIIETACQLVGKVNYFWGGKSLVLGWDSRWGTTMQVTAPGSSSSGTYRPYGMDCSGYVDWVFYNATGGEYIIGHGGGAAAQHSYCTTIAWDEALPGDLVFYPEDSHVGIVGGRDESGNLLIIHCASGYNNVVITGIEGFTSIGRPVYFSD